MWAAYQRDGLLRWKTHQSLDEWLGQERTDDVRAAVLGLTGESHFGWPVILRMQSSWEDSQDKLPRPERSLDWLEKYLMSAEHVHEASSTEVPSVHMQPWDVKSVPLWEAGLFIYHSICKLLRSAYMEISIIYMISKYSVCPCLARRFMWFACHTHY